MGDRVNVRFVQRDDAPAIWLYSHWGGYGMPRNLQSALQAASGRWTDPAYGCRMIVSQLIGDQWADEHGYGLSTSVGDNEHDLLEVNFPAKEVRLYRRQDGSWHEFESTPLKTWTFEEYVALEAAGWTDLCAETAEAE